MPFVIAYPEDNFDAKLAAGMVREFVAHRDFGDYQCIAYDEHTTNLMENRPDWDAIVFADNLDDARVLVDHAAARAKRIMFICNDSTAGSGVESVWLEAPRDIAEWLTQDGAVATERCLVRAPNTYRTLAHLTWMYLNRGAPDGYAPILAQMSDVRSLESRDAWIITLNADATKIDACDDLHDINGRYRSTLNKLVAPLSSHRHLDPYGLRYLAREGGKLIYLLPKRKLAFRGRVIPTLLAPFGMGVDDEALWTLTHGREYACVITQDRREPNGTISQSVRMLSANHTAHVWMYQYLVTEYDCTATVATSSRVGTQTQGRILFDTPLGWLGERQ